jgi:hypothetical protein
MKRSWLALMPLGLALAAATPPRLAEFKGHSPVALIFAPTADDSRFASQTTELAKLTAKPKYQSLIVVGVSGGTVITVSDSAQDLRKRFGVPAGAFRVVMVDSSAHLALSQGIVATTAKLASTLDATSGAEPAPQARRPVQ